LSRTIDGVDFHKKRCAYSSICAAHVLLSAEIYQKQYFSSCDSGSLTWMYIGIK